MLLLFLASPVSCCFARSHHARLRCLLKPLPLPGYPPPVPHQTASLPSRCGGSGPQCATSPAAPPRASSSFKSAALRAPLSHRRLPELVFHVTAPLPSAFSVGLAQKSITRRRTDLEVRRPARLGDHPRPKYVQRSWLLIFLDERLKLFFQTFEGSQVRAGIPAMMLLLQSDCSLYVEASAKFHVAKYEITEKMSLRNFIVILNYKSCFRVSRVYDPKYCICNGSLV
ncbi:hypothetical protein BRADI_5g12255v3 [Brachypodium distachyon]|uniref:Secreted protein n=1 Tax=Brachypodium distachyon TaxID=15368 RepID=A0A2K2CGR6_BRADI|nr:hypothetical protein BRADI_5g12255v3 [Brachypodium distachyon]